MSIFPSPFPDPITFTPAFVRGTPSNGVPVFTINSCKYSIGGRMLFFGFDITITGLGTTVAGDTLEVATPFTTQGIGMGAGRANIQTGAMLQVQLRGASVALFTYANGVALAAGEQYIMGVMVPLA